MKKKELLEELWWHLDYCNDHMKRAYRKERYAETLSKKYHYEFIAKCYKEKFDYYKKYYDLLKNKAYVGTARWISYIQQTSLDMSEFIERVDKYLERHSKGE